MKISSVALPPVEAKPAALFVALELSKSTWLVALHSPAADKVSQHRLEGGDAEGLLTLIGRRRAHAEAVLGRPVRVVSCYEAGYDGFWLHRLLCHRDIANRVLDAASILVDRRCRRAKTDRLDAAALLRTLMALERSESLPGGARAERRAGRRPTPQSGTGSAGQRARSALEPHQGTVDDTWHSRLCVFETGLARAAR